MRQRATDKYWSDYYKRGQDFISVNSQELKQFLTYTQKTAPKTALDIGCGTGQLTRDLYHSGYKVVGVDASETALKIAQSLSVVPRAQLRYIQCDIEKETLTKLPLSPYGLIICQSAYAFINNKEKLLTGVSKVLDPKGTFIIISMLDKNVPSHKQVAALNPEATHALLQNYFQVTYYEKAGLGYFICTQKA